MHRLPGVIEQREDIAVHVPGHVEIAIDKGIEPHEGAEFIGGPILDHGHLFFGGALDVGRGGRVEIEQVGPVAARADLGGAVDQIGFAQAPLDLALAFAQNLAVARRDPLTAGAVDAPGERQRIRDQVFALLQFIGLRRGERTAHHAAHPLGKPPLKTEIHGQHGKDRHRDRRDQRHQRENTRQPQVQPRSRRLGPPRRDEPCHLAEDKCRNEQDIDQIGQEDQPQRGAVRPLPQRPEHKIGRQRQNRPQHHQPEGGKIANASHPPQTAKPYER